MSIGQSRLKVRAPKLRTPRAPPTPRAPRTPCKNRRQHSSAVLVVVTATFVGDVSQGNLTNRVVANYSIRGSKVPQSGTPTALGLVPQDFDNVFKWNVGTQSFDTYLYLFGGYSPSEPTFNVGESFFLSSGAAYDWTRTFSVN